MNTSGCVFTTQASTPKQAQIGSSIDSGCSPVCFIMAQTPPTPISHFIGLNYQSIFDSALEAYEKKTGKDLTSDPLLHRLETCHSPDDILDILQEHISGFDQFRSSSDGLTKWLNPIVNVLYTSSSIIGSLGLVSLGILEFTLNYSFRRHTHLYQ